MIDEMAEKIQLRFANILVEEELLKSVNFTDVEQKIYLVTGVMLAAVDKLMLEGIKNAKNNIVNNAENMVKFNTYAKSNYEKLVYEDKKSLYDFLCKHILQINKTEKQFQSSIVKNYANNKKSIFALESYNEYQNRKLYNCILKYGFMGEYSNFPLLPCYLFSFLQNYSGSDRDDITQIIDFEKSY